MAKTITYTTSYYDEYFIFANYQNGWPGAICQGNYVHDGSDGVNEASSNTSQRIGFISLTGIGNSLKDKTITSIKFTFKFEDGGDSSWNGPNKVLKMYTCKQQDVGVSDESYPYRVSDYFDSSNKVLGSLNVYGYDSTETFTLSISENATLFAGVSEYFADGNYTIIIYNDEPHTSTHWSPHFLYITSVTAEITYTDGTAYIDNGTSFDAYQVYIDNGTSFEAYIPYIDTGTEWVPYE